FNDVLAREFACDEWGDLMRLGRNLLALALTTLVGPGGSYPPTANSQGPLDSAKPFLGRWDLTLKTPDREYPSWLEITQEEEQLKARMVGRWGHARMLPKAEL